MHTSRWWTWWRRTAAAARRRRRRRWRAGRGRSATCRTSGPDPPPLAVPVRGRAETPRRPRRVSSDADDALRRATTRAPPSSPPSPRARSAGRAARRARLQTRGSSPASRPRRPGGALRALPPAGHWALIPPFLAHPRPAGSGPSSPCGPAAPGEEPRPTILAGRPAGRTSLFSSNFSEKGAVLLLRRRVLLREPGEQTGFLTGKIRSIPAPGGRAGGLLPVIGRCVGTVGRGRAAARACRATGDHLSQRRRRPNRSRARFCQS